MGDPPPVIIPPTQVAQAKDQRVSVLAGQIVELMRAHPYRHEAFDALDVARVFFRPSYPPTSEDQAFASQSHAGVSESLEEIR